jgi:hypothetical protein
MVEEHLVLRDVDAGVLLELGDQPVDDHLVDVVAAQVGVAVGGQHLDDLVADLEDGDVEGAAAEVVDGDLLVRLLVEAVGQRRGGGLVDDAPDVQAGDLAGVLGGLALGVVEVGRHGDDRVGDLLAQVVLRGPLQLEQDLRADLGCAQRLPVDLDARVAARAGHDLVRNPLGLFLDLVGPPTHEPLDAVDGPLGVGDGLPLGDLADQPLPVLQVCDDRWRDAGALLVRDDDGVLALHHRDHRVGGAQVDADDLSHVLKSSRVTDKLSPPRDASNGSPTSLPGGRCAHVGA